jgi:membrane associated rhomboid family serine protease
MFPIRDENPTLRTSIVTFGIITANILIWIFVQGLGSDPFLTKSIIHYGLIPAQWLGQIPPGTKISLSHGVAFVAKNTPYGATIVTSMFMHAGWLHLIGNMWFLGIFGDNVEDVMGRMKFLIFYLLCGLGAAGAQMVSDPTSTVPMIGASGAIGGVLGAYAILFPRAPVHMLVFLGFFITRIVVPAFLMLGYWFLLQFFGGLYSRGSGAGVAFWAHIGGFVTGIALVPFFRSGKKLEALRRRRGNTDRVIRRVYRT